ncbi:hypothetical protein BKA62DRAFT_692690 [Auriculariales sp. MPI-PUGE-AT-0066]|nr:hypothetical protein BKA62DRAFT_692690 [Auriculariales sp. MPI-PUGE-AT-0066]
MSFSKYSVMVEEAPGPPLRRRVALGMAFALVTSATTAGLYALGPGYTTNPLSGAFSLSHSTMAVISGACNGEDNPRDSLFVLHTQDDNYNSTYIPFAPPIHGSAPPQTAALEYVDSLPLRCLDAFISHGATCEERPHETAERIRQTKFDVVWTWVNGTDHMHQQAALDASRDYFHTVQRQSSKLPSQLKLYREHDELRHSMRSIDPDNWDNETCISNSSLSWRLGQIPQFLDFNQDVWEDGDIELRLTHHSQFFTNYTGTTFNSFAIESQIGHVEGLSNHIIYLNDDYFFSSPLKPFDFFTPPFGHVLRIQPDLLVTPASRKTFPSDGEWLSLEHTNELLSQRFGFRQRPYAVHEAKAASTPLLRELAHAFPDAIVATSQNRFRATPKYPQRDVHPFFMYCHWVVERHREAALWVWAVAKSLERGDDWMQRAWKEIGGGSEHSMLQVRAQKRRTLATEHLEDMLGKENIGNTSYKFASMDGYPYAALGLNGVREWPDMQLPRGRVSDERIHPHFGCQISYETCFRGSSPVEFFTHIAFEEVQCGDCILTALVKASGELGLEALLPQAKSSVVEPTRYHSPPALPRVPKWQDADFSVSANVPVDADLRTWSVQLLARYRFVVGSTPARFVSLRTLRSTSQTLDRLDKDQGSYNLLCVNDDIYGDPLQVDRLFRFWQNQTWPAAAAWEKPEAPMVLNSRRQISSSRSF